MREIEEYVPTAYISNATGLAQLTVRRWVESGRLPGGKIGNMVVVERAAADEAIAAHHREARRRRRQDRRTRA